MEGTNFSDLEGTNFSDLEGTNFSDLEGTNGGDMQVFVCIFACTKSYTRYVHILLFFSLLTTFAKISNR